MMGGAGCRAGEESGCCAWAPSSGACCAALSKPVCTCCELYDNAAIVLGN